jgi:FlaA1/EpsC-like NDP-sugar epimerase
MEENKAYITDKEMTRFWVLIDDVAKFMILKASTEIPGVYIPAMRAAPVVDIARATAKVLGIEDYMVEFSGIRPGEKIHECLISSHKYCLRSDDKTIHYSDAELIDLVRIALNEC